MPHYKYLIVGGGMTADAAVKGIRSVDDSGSIGLISLETSPPYKRPPLTKGLWKGKPEDGIWLKTADYGIEMHLGKRVEQLDADSRRVRDDLGIDYTYDRLLLATGGAPRRFPFPSEWFIYYRTFDDYRHLRRLTEECDKFAVIGSGFIGSEIAAALAMNKKQVTMIFPEESIGQRLYPKELARFLNGYYQDHGVELLAGETITGARTQNGRQVVTMQGGHEIGADAVVAGIGIVPNTELAEQAGLGVDNGIRVDETLQTSYPGIYSSGDVAGFYDPALDRWLRVEHEDNAVMMGQHAGRSMAGQVEPYTHLPYFYSDLFDLGYEAVGEVDSRHDVFADWKDPFKEGVVYYLKDSRIRGVLLWNVWDKVAAARELIASPGPFGPDNLVGRIA